MLTIKQMQNMEKETLIAIIREQAYFISHIKKSLGKNLDKDFNIYYQNMNKLQNAI